MNSETSPLISVVIPVFNAEKYLRETLNSILSQTYANIEVIAVDDGSSDHSISILESYPNVTVFKQPNSGPATARNRGVQEARGDWIAFLDSDDIWSPEKLERQMQSLEGELWSHTDSSFKGGVNHGLKASDFTPKLGGEILPALVQENFIGTSTVLIQKQFFLASGGFDTRLNLIEDWEFWVRLAAKQRIAYVDQPLVQYRVHPTSVSRGTRKTLPYHIQVIEGFFAKDGPAEQLNYLEKSTKAKSYSICSYIAEEEHDYGFSLRCSFNAWRCKPLSRQYIVRLFKCLAKFVLSYNKQ